MHMSVCISVCLSTHTLTTHFTIAYFDDMGLSPWIFIPHQLLSTVINGQQLSSTVINCHHSTPPVGMRIYQWIYATIAHHLFSVIFKSVSCCHILQRLLLSHVCVCVCVF
mmetsp:Transcript_24458/g.39389  ORF Transcript_24458/g.39389 Transcript_24458/m.39389 type:complete len:110 (-) Transcript_24458:153-482(-)